jgi:MoaA/NifB/PqqE/SkfB family radical SAM enzyme
MQEPKKRQESSSAEISACHFPNRVTVELTNRCNLRCAMCPRKFMESEQGFMSPNLFCKIVDEMVKHSDIALVPFFRGEPLLHPDFINMMAYAKRHGIAPVQLTTNGLLLSENLSREIIELQLDFLSISVDSIEPAVYKKIRRGSDLGSVIKNVESLCEMKTRCGADKPELQVSMVRTSNNSEGLSAFVAFWLARVDRVRVYEEHSSNGNFGALTKDEAKKDVNGRLPCMKPFTDMVIYWNGFAALCNHDWDRQAPLGDASNSTLSEIWNGLLYRKQREAQMGNRPLDIVCAGCDHWKAFYSETKMVGELHVRAKPKSAGSFN